MYIPRLIETKINQNLSQKEILILLGARQVGKTTLITQIAKKHKTVFFNLDVEVDKEKLLALATYSPKSSYQALGTPELLVIDEAQRLPQMISVYKGWYDSGLPLKIILLGSSTLDLKVKTEALTGRNYKIYLPPLTFKEFIKKEPNLLPEMPNSLAALLSQYLIFGGYPAVIKAHDKVEYLLNLTSDYMLKDIFQLGLIKSTSTMRKLLMLLAFQIGSLVSINELANKLAVSRVTVERYLELLEEVFIIFRLPSFSKNQRREIIRSQKIYFYDTGLRNALLKNFDTSSYRADLGHLWENLVVSEFAKENLLTGSKKNLYFWRTRDGSELDLVVKEGEQLQAYEIKLNRSRTKKTHPFTQRYEVPVVVINQTKFIYLKQ